MFCSSVQNRDNLHDRVGSDSLFQVFINLRKFSTLLLTFGNVTKSVLKIKRNVTKSKAYLSYLLKAGKYAN